VRAEVSTFLGILCCALELCCPFPSSAGAIRGSKQEAGVGLLYRAASPGGQAGSFLGSLPGQKPPQLL